MIRNQYLCPIANNLFDQMKGVKIFSKRYLRSGYHPLKIKEKHIFKTTFRTHFCHFESTIVSFGLRNAPKAFMSLMNVMF